MAVHSDVARCTLGEVPVDRKLLHTRQVVCQGYLRSDGLWEVEGRLCDVRTADVVSRTGEVLVKAGDTLHGMRLLLTIDSAFTIVDARAHTERSPHQECASVGEAYASLRGMVIGAGFIPEVKKRFRGISGCTHLTELIGPVATTAIQTILSWREQHGELRAESMRDAPAGKVLSLVDSCHAWRREGEAFKAH